MDVRPLTVADAVLVAGYVDHVARRTGTPVAPPARHRCRHALVRLLVSDHDQAVVLLLTVKRLDRLAELAAVVRLRRADGIAPTESTTRRHLNPTARASKHHHL